MVESIFSSDLFVKNPLPCWICARGTGEVLAVNPAAIASFGFEKKYYLKKLLSDVLEGYTPTVNHYGEPVVLKLPNALSLPIKIMSCVVESDGNSYHYVISNGETIEDLLSDSFSFIPLQEFKNAINKTSIISILDKRGNIAYVNDNYVTKAKVGREEILGKRFSFISQDQQSLEFHHELWSSITSGQTWRGEICGSAKDGSLFWLDTYIVPVQDKHGTIKQFLSIQNDITERKNAIQQSLNSREMLSNAFRFAEIGYADLQLATNTIILSPELLCVFNNNTTETEVLTIEQFADKYICSHKKQFLKIFYKAIIDGVNELIKLKVEFQVLCADKAVKDVEALISIDDVQRGIIVIQDITVQKRALNDARDKGTRIENIINGISGGFFAVDKHWKFILVNPLFEKFARKKASELIGQFAWNIFPEYINTPVHYHYARAMQERVPVTFEFDYVNGSVHEVHIYPNADGLFVYFHDISERKRSERKIIESENKIKAFFNSTADAYFLLDRQCRIMAFNRSSVDYVHQFYGLSVEEGDSFHKFIRPAYQKKFLDFMKVALDGERISNEYLLRFNKHTKHWLKITVSPLYDEDGKVSGVVFSASDINDRKRVEAEVNKLALLVSHTRNGMMLTDASGCITWVNEGFERMSGYRINEIIGKRPGEFLQGPHTNEEVVKMMREKIRLKQGFKVELLNYTKAGREVWVDLEVIPLRDNAGEVIGFIGLELEITELKRAIKELIKTQELLRQIVENAPMDVFVKNKDGEYVFYNKSFISHLSEADKYPVLNDSLLFSLEDLQRIRNQDTYIFESGSIVQVEQQFNRNGSSGTYYTTKFPLFDAEGSVYALGGISLNISERKALERTLLENEHKIRLALDTALICTWDWNLHTNEVNWGGRVERLFGKSKHELKNPDVFYSLIHLDDLEYLQGKIDKVFNQNEDYLAEFRIVKDDGEIAWMSGAGLLMRDESGEAYRMVGINMDITERVLSFEKTKANERRFRDLTDNAPAIIWESDANHNLIFANRTFYEFSGVLMGTTLHQTWKRVMKRSDVRLFEVAYKRALVDKASFQLELRLTRHDGTIRWFLSTATPRFDETNVFIGFVGFCFDITERKQADAALQNSEALYKSVIQTQKEMICRFTPAGKLTFVNEAYCKAHGKSTHDLLGTSVLHVRMDRLLAQRKTGFHKLVANPQPHLEQVALLNGNYCWQEWTDSPIFDEAGELLEIQSVGNDVTERVFANEAMNRLSTRLLLATNAAKLGIWELNLFDNSSIWDSRTYDLFDITPNPEHSPYNAWQERIHPDDRIEHGIAIKNALNGEGDYESEYRIIKRDGSIRFITSHGLVQRNDMREPLAIVGVSWDITDRKLSEMALADSEKRFRNLVKDLSVGVLVHNEKGNVILANDYITGLMNVGERDLIDDGNLSFYLYDERGSHLVKEEMPFNMVIRTHQEIRNKIVGVSGRNQEKINWLMVDSIPFFDDWGNLMYVTTTGVNITMLIETERALRVSEERWQFALEGSGDGVWDWNLQTNEVYYSKQLKKMIGYEENELKPLLSEWKTRIHPDDEQIVLNALDDYYQGKTSTYHCEHRLRCKDGSYKWILDRGIITEYNAGEPLRMIGTHTDITERKNSEDKLLTLSNRLSLATSSAGIGIWDWNLEDGVLELDEQCRFLFGISTEASEISMNEWMNLIHAEDRERIKENFQTALDDDHLYNTVYRIIRHGDIRYLQSYGVVKRYDNGVGIRMIGTCWDITVEKRYEKSLKESEQRLSLATRAAQIGVWEWNVKANTLQWDQNVFELFGFPRSLFEGTLESQRQRIYPDDCDAFDAAMKTALESQEDFKVNYRINRHDNNEIRYVQSFGTVIADKESQGMRVLGVMLDVTQQQENENALREVTERLTLATQAANLGIWDLDVVNDVLYWDETMFSLFGVVRKDHLSSTDWANSLHPEEVSYQLEVLNKCMNEGGEVYSTEFRIIRFEDQEIRLIKALGSIRRDASGKAVRLIGVNWDITEEKQRELDLIQGEARYRSIVDDQRELICRFIADGSITFANKSYLDAFSLNSENLPDNSFVDLFVGELRTYGQSLIDNLFSGRSFSAPFEIMTRIANQPRWIQWITIPLKNEEGIVYEVQAIGQDITARKNLELQQKKLDKIVRETYNEIYLFDSTDLRFEFANDSALLNLGYSLSELLDMKVTDLFHYPNEMALMIMIRALESGDTDRLQLQLKHRRKDGSYYDIDVLVQVLEDKSLVAIGTDITQKLITEKRLLATIQEKEMLIKEIHHRVKNNLQLISSIIYLKLASVQESGIKNFLNEMRQKIRSIALIHERLLQTENLDKIEISDYLTKMVYDIQVSNKREDLQLAIKTHFDESFIDLDSAIYCALIVNELITNSLKHAYKQQREGVIRVSFEVGDKDNVLTVEDDGNPIPEGVHPGASNSFGMNLLEIFIKQLSGVYTISRENGTGFKIKFPKK